MGTTYLELTNKVLRKLNEIELTSATFATATGFHALVKDLVKEAIADINQEETRWPFNHGTVSQVCVADQATYDLPADLEMVDWGTFYLEEDGTLVVSAKPLGVVDYTEWHNRYRANEQLATSGSVNLPNRIYRTQDEKFGVSPIPDRAYTISYEYWKDPTALDLYSDTCLIPTRFDRVITSHAIMGAYDFRENYEMAGKEYSIYKRGLKTMKKLLINRNYEYAYDTRSRSVTSGRNNGWSK